MDATPSVRPRPAIAPVHPARIIAVVLALLLFISFAATWYAREVTLPRYCENPMQNLNYLEQVLSQPAPAGKQSRRPYIIAARLLFLIPRESGEPADAYLRRVRQRLGQRCR